MTLRYKWDKREDGRYMIYCDSEPIVIVDNEITAGTVAFELNKAYDDGYEEGFSHYC